MRVVLALLILLVPAVPRADEELPQARGEGTTGDEAPRNYVNFRVGGSTGTLNGRPDLCLELSPIDAVSIEGCGTGSGFLHADPEPELAHFAAKIRLANRKTSFGWLQPHASIGFAELSVGEDSPGFEFDGVGRDGVETAGLETGVSVRLVIPTRRGLELVIEARISVAYLPHAPELISPQREIMPSAGGSVGFGF